MRNKKYYGLLGLASLLAFSYNVDAKEFKSTEIPNSTYIIGEHMFTRDIEEGSDYKGQLTTPLIMLTSKTINNDSLNNMHIYQKTARGKWVDATINKEITPPSTFNIKFKNTKRIEEIKYGDVNNDGNVDTKDLTLILRHNSGEFSDIKIDLDNADINDNNIVDYTDVKLLSNYFAGNYTKNDLNSGPIKTSNIKLYISRVELYRTFDEAIGYKIIEKIEEPKCDGYYFSGWYTDKEYKNLYDFNKPVTSDLNLYAKFNKIMYGDANNDGKLNARDTTTILKYISGDYPDNVINLDNADVNNDKVIDFTDVKLLSNYIARNYPGINLNNGPIKSNKIKLFTGGGKFKIFGEATGYKIIEKIEEPKKDGYYFAGWYTDEEYKNLYDFNKPVTSDLNLYAKFNKIKYGDTNEDGEIHIDDIHIIGSYVNGNPDFFKNNNKILANFDITGDGIINERDYYFARKILGGWFDYLNVPNEPVGENYRIFLDYPTSNKGEEVIHFAVANHPFNFNIIDSHIEKGKKFVGWYTDSEYKNKYDVNAPVKSDLKLYAKYENLPYGDINEDGKIDAKDLDLLDKHLNGINVNINDNADINVDGKIDFLDSMFLNRIVNNKYPSIKLNNPLDISRVTFMYDKENIFDTIYEINGHNLKDKLKKPVKEGFVFDGWYWGTDLNNPYNGNLNVDKDIQLYPKFTPVNNK